jgi:hypothetical protein
LHLAAAAGCSVSSWAAVGTASANVAKANRGGTPNGEPEGIRDVAIRHEELEIDLRPIADAGSPTEYQDAWERATMIA